MAGILTRLWIVGCAVGAVACGLLTAVAAFVGTHDSIQRIERDAWMEAHPIAELPEGKGNLTESETEELEGLIRAQEQARPLTDSFVEDPPTASDAERIAYKGLAKEKRAEVSRLIRGGEKPSAALKTVLLGVHRDRAWEATEESTAMRTGGSIAAALGGFLAACLVWKLLFHLGLWIATGRLRAARSGSS